MAGMRKSYAFSELQLEALLATAIKLSMAWFHQGQKGDEFEPESLVGEMMQTLQTEQDLVECGYKPKAVLQAVELKRNKTGFEFVGNGKWLRLHRN